MYDKALEILRDAKKKMETAFEGKNHSSVEAALLERADIHDVEDAIATLESVAEACEDAEPTPDGVFVHDGPPS